jgi:hypothetical protein
MTIEKNHTFAIKVATKVKRLFMICKERCAITKNKMQVFLRKERKDINRGYYLKYKRKINP